MLGQLSGDDVLEGHTVEDEAQASAYRHPDQLEVLRGRLVLGGFRADPPHLGQRPLEAAEDLSHSDLGCGPGELVTTLVAPLAGDDADRA